MYGDLVCLCIVLSLIRLEPSIINTAMIVVLYLDCMDVSTWHTNQNHLLLLTLTCLVLGPIYAHEYELGDVVYTGLCCFMLFMAIVWSTSTQVQLFMAWECLTVSSSALIGMLHTDTTIRASAKALIYNLITGAAMMVFLQCSGCIRGDGRYLIGLMLSGGVKRATFPFHGWLITAMCAPIIVSTLLQSATLVLAMVAIGIRCDLVVKVDGTIPWHGLSVLMLSGWALTHDTDVKWILAYSTGVYVGNGCKYMHRLVCDWRSYTLWNRLVQLHGLGKAQLFILLGISAMYMVEWRARGPTKSPNPLLCMCFFSQWMTVIRTIDRCMHEDKTHKPFIIDCDGVVYVWGRCELLEICMVAAMSGVWQETLWVSKGSFVGDSSYTPFTIPTIPYEPM